MNIFFKDKELNILKAIMPFFPSDTRRFLAIYIAIKELANSIELINMIGNNRFDKSFSSNQSTDFSNILNSIKRFLNPEEIEMIDNYMNMFNMMKMMNEMSSMFEGEDESNSDSSSPFNMDILKSMLSPEQTAMFETLSNLN